MHKPTVSDDALERRIYEQAARDEEAFLVEHFKTILADFEPPPGWRKKKGPGRPRRKRPGRKEEFGWRPMVIVLLLKALHGLTYREMTSHLRANPGLCARIGMPRAPSPGTMRDALDRIPQAWLKRLNQRLVESGKKDPAARATSRRGWTVLE